MIAGCDMMFSRARPINIGLGLFMSYEIAVNGYGADIRVDRKEGMTQFTISLPLVAESSPVFAALNAPAQTAVRT